MAPVLEFNQVTMPGHSSAECGVENLSLRLSPGESAWIECELECAVVDLACGLREPATGTVRFQGESWRATSPRGEAERRGRIGRVFWDTAWLSNLDLDENVTLARRHLDPGRAGHWADEALRIAAALGLSLVPGLRPAFASARDLQRAQFARALLGEPALLLLEHADRAVSGADLARFLAEVGKARERGAAVLWVGPSSPRLNPDAVHSELRLDLRDTSPMVPPA